MDRQTIAYGIIAAIVIVAVPFGLRTWDRHKRRRLRRQGIKRYGH